MRSGKERKLHYAWVICIACCLVFFCNGGMTLATSSTNLTLIREFSGISNTQCSTIQMIRNISALASMVFVDRIIAHFGAKRSIMGGLAFLSASFVVNAFASGFFGYCAAAVLSGIGYSLGGMIPMSLILSRWFISRRSLALGITTMGSGAALMIIPPIITGLNNRFSLRFAFMSEALFIAAVGVFCAFALANDPSHRRLKPLSEDMDVVGEDRSFPEETASPRYMWMLYAAVLLISLTTHGGVPSMSLHLVTEGFTTQEAAFYISLYGVFLTIGKAIYGYTTDRAGALKTSVVYYVFAIIGMGLCCMIGGAYGRIIVIAAFFFWGIGNTISTVALPVLAAEMSNAKTYLRNVRNMQLTYTLGSVLIGPLPGMVADRFGSYIPAFAAFTVILAFSLFLTVTALHRRYHQLWRAS